MTHTLVTCPDEELFVNLQLGTLSPDERSALMQHIDRCGSCTELLSVLTHMEQPEHAFHSEELLPKKNALRIGRYEVIAQAGLGGVGVVYKARDTRLNRLVAIKLLRPDLLSARPEQAHEASLRLQREAHTLAGLDHPHIVTIHDIGDHDGQIFIACAFIEGENMREWLAHKARSWQEIVTLSLHVARALEAAHHVGVIHRDVKPENILVRAGDHALLTDFGMATLPTPTSSVTLTTHDLATQQGMILGTPAYMSPEQLDGQPPLAASDQFSLCVTLYEALHGFRPYHATTYQELLHVLKQGNLTRPHSSTLPPQLFDILATGLRPRPDERHQDMSALIALLEHTLAAPLDAAPRPSRTFIALALLLVCGLGSLALFLHTPPVHTTDTSLTQHAPTSTEPVTKTTEPVAKTLAQPVAAPVVASQAAPSQAPPASNAQDTGTPPVEVASLTTSTPAHDTPRASRRSKRHVAPTPTVKKTPTTADIPHAVIATFEDRKAFHMAVLNLDGAACKKHYDSVITSFPQWEMAQADNILRLECEYLQGTCSHAKTFERILPTQIVPQTGDAITRHNLTYAHPSCLTSAQDKILGAAHRLNQLCGMASGSSRCARSVELLHTLIATHPDEPATQDRVVTRALQFGKISNAAP